MLFPRIQPRIAAAIALLAAGAAAVLLMPLAGANHGDIHAHCQGDTAVVTSRPAGTEHVKVICRNGLPELMVDQEDPAVYDPVASPLPRATPPEFAGWVTVQLNNHQLLSPFDPVRQVQEPAPFLTSRGRVMIPVRFFTEAFGGHVVWHPEDRSVRLTLPGNPRTLHVWVDRFEATVNGKPERLDQPAVLFQDRVFVPVRFLVEGFGAAIEWDQLRYRALIYMDNVTCSSRLYCGEVS